MENIFIKTSNYLKFMEICNELAGDGGQIGPSLAMVWGRAGRGKTAAAQYWAVQHDGIYVRTLPIMTPLAVLREIAFYVSQEKPHTTRRCLDLIQADKRRRVILIDEADLLHMEVLETLRGVNEITGSPIVLIGEEPLPGRVASRRRIVSRIRLRQEFGPLAQPDIAVFFKHAMKIELTPDCVSALYKKSGGDWRPMLTKALAIERAMKASDLREVTVSMIDEL